MKPRSVWIAAGSLLALLAVIMLATHRVEEDLWGPWLKGQDSSDADAEHDDTRSRSKVENASAFYRRGGSERLPDEQDEIRLEVRLNDICYLRLVGIDNDGYAEALGADEIGLGEVLYEPKSAEGDRKTHRFGPYPVHTSIGSEISKILIVCSAAPLSDEEFAAALEGIAACTRSAEAEPELDVFFVVPRDP